MIFQIFTNNDHYTIYDTSTQCNLPTIDDLHELYYSEYFSPQLTEIKRSTYSTVFKDNHQTYIMYLFHYSICAKKAIEIQKDIYRKQLGVTENTFKCSGFFSNAFKISSNFQLDDSPSTYFSFGKFKFAKDINNIDQNYLNKQNYDLYFNNKFPNAAAETWINIVNQINQNKEDLKAIYCENDFLNIDLTSAEIQDPTFNFNIQDLSAKILQLSGQISGLINQ